MNNTDDQAIAEQLSAYLDGELTEADARFLRRRLEHDVELRAKWNRMCIAADCLKGHPLRLMASDLCSSVSVKSTELPRQRTILPWAVAASLAALAFLFSPVLRNPESTPVALAVPSSIMASNPIASPASADLVSITTVATTAVPVATTPSQNEPDTTSDITKTSAGPFAQSPLSLSSVQSPTEFPLADSADKRHWPRSTLAGNRNDSNIEAYLVRHNQMLSGDGLGGFIPYVDVMTADPANDSGQLRNEAQTK